MALGGPGIRVGPNVFFWEPNASDANVRTNVRTDGVQNPSFQIAREIYSDPLPAAADYPRA